MVFRVYAWLYAWGSLVVLRVQVQGIEHGSVIKQNAGRHPHYCTIAQASLWLDSVSEEMHDFGIENLASASMCVSVLLAKKVSVQGLIRGVIPVS